MSTVVDSYCALQGFVIVFAIDVGLEALPMVTKTSRQGRASSPYADILRPFRADQTSGRIYIPHIGREFRSANTLPDSAEKTIWGDAQKQSLMETVEASDATFKILFTATAVVGPDRDSKKDNHANQVFQKEGESKMIFSTHSRSDPSLKISETFKRISTDGIGARIILLNKI
jgi:hypothetical protein